MSKIPKVIHYCWFGRNKLPKLARKCIKSWKKYLPDYEIIEWNESNYDISKNRYMREAYEAKKWGFVPDYARLDIIQKYGGFYLDTDVELIKCLDEYRKYPCFFGVEKPDKAALGLGFGAEPGNSIITEMLQQYDEMSFLKDDGTYDLTPSPEFQTKIMNKYGVYVVECIKQIDNKCYIFPKDYFNPYNMDSGLIEVSENTVSIHHYAGSWVDSYSKFRGKVYQLIYRFGGQRIASIAQKIFGRKK